jgi:hypothetical protein
MSLSIPFTQTTANYTDPNAAVFPAEVGASTPFTSGYLIVGNASAYVSIYKGDGRGGAGWGPDFPITGSPNAYVPLLGGARQSIFGVRARDAVAGTHALISGALFQAGEASVTPSATFSGTIGGSGGYIPAASVITGIVSGAGVAVSGTGFTSVRVSPGVYTITLTTPQSSPLFQGTAFTAGVIVSGSAMSNTIINVSTVDWSGGIGTFVDSEFQFTAQNTA